MPYFEVFSWRYWGRTRYLFRITSLLAQIWTWDLPSTPNTKQKCQPPGGGGRCKLIRDVQFEYRITNFCLCKLAVLTLLSSSSDTAAILVPLSRDTHAHFAFRSTSSTVSTGVYISGGKTGQNVSHTADVPPRRATAKKPSVATKFQYEPS